MMAAMVDYPACAAPIAAVAQTCPRCGHVLRRPQRGVFGWLFLLLFWGWNGLMAAWLVASVGAWSETAKTFASDAERTGHALGAGIGVTFIVGFWAVGAVIFGLMTLVTRPR